MGSVSYERLVLRRLHERERERERERETTREKLMLVVCDTNLIFLIFISTADITPYTTNCTKVMNHPYLIA